MKTSILLLAFIVCSCQPRPEALTGVQKAAIADSAKAVFEAVLTNSDKLDFATAFQSFSGDPDARFVENGMLYPSLDAMKVHASLPLPPPAHRINSG